MTNADFVSGACYGSETESAFAFYPRRKSA
jgi:hypothetical protein